MAVAGALRGQNEIKNDPFAETLMFWMVFDQILKYLCDDNMATQFRAFGSDVRSLRRKSDLAEFIRRSRGSQHFPPIPAKWRKGRSSQPPFTCAGG